MQMATGSSYNVQAAVFTENQPDPIVRREGATHPVQHSGLEAITEASNRLDTLQAQPLYAPPVSYEYPHVQAPLEASSGHYPTAGLNLNRFSQPLQYPVYSFSPATAQSFGAVTQSNINGRNVWCMLVPSMSPAASISDGDKRISVFQPAGRYESAAAAPVVNDAILANIHQTAFLATPVLEQRPYDGNIPLPMNNFEAAEAPGQKKRKRSMEDDAEFHDIDGQKSTASDDFIPRKNLRCKVPGCPYQTNRPKLMVTHMQCHEDEETDARTIHKCGYPNCGYMGKDSSNLKVHIRTHTGARPFACIVPGCSFTASQSNTVKTHLKKTHRMPNPPLLRSNNNTTHLTL